MKEIGFLPSAMVDLWLRLKRQFPRNLWHYMPDFPRNLSAKFPQIPEKSMAQVPVEEGVTLSFSQLSCLLCQLKG